MHDRFSKAEAWFASQGWSPLPYQRKTWQAFVDGESGLVHAPTGIGKTLAVWLGPLTGASAAPKRSGLRVLWITPLRALARDTVSALQAPLEAFGLDWRVEMRTGDVSSYRRQKQRQDLPHALVTTPESLSLLLSYPESGKAFSDLDAVIVDEWHELLGSKRGVQTELALARLRTLRPGLRIWGLSATLGNMEEAARALIGANGPCRCISHPPESPPDVTTLLPDSVERFPQAGRLGLKLLERALEVIAGEGTTLIFTNTRAQAELWYQAILDAKPDWREEIALHHGSIDRVQREAAEAGLRAESLRCVVCTSSLDLGVDFPAVTRVIQIGSPKGAGRLLQRAGRSGHQPGRRSRIFCVPTHAMEIVEFAAAREAIRLGSIEARHPVRKPLDLLAQHLLTVATGGGFQSEQMLAEVRSTAAYQDLTQQEWDWTIEFLTKGGPALGAYPEYRRLARSNGAYRVASEQISKRHRMSIGTITSDGEMRVRFLRGKEIGTVEESFIARLRPGDRFVLSGKRVELVRTRDMTAWVRLAKAHGVVPRWAGGRMPLSTALAGAVLQQFDIFREQGARSAELTALAPLLRLQMRWSHLPGPRDLLIERTSARGQHYLLVYPFAGRLAHEGIALLMAHRLTRSRPQTFRIAANDYGFVLRSDKPVDLSDSQFDDLLTTAELLTDIIACLNDTEVARRKFREIARVAGLVFQGFPGRTKQMRHLQASSGLFFDVFERYDPDNLLLRQARQEALEQQLQFTRIETALVRMAEQSRIIRAPERLTPFAFPLWAETTSEQVSSESWMDRIAKAGAALEAAAAHDDEPAGR